MKAIVERFYRYIKIDTKSTWDSGTVPSSENQFVLGRMLVDELKKMGISDARIDEKSFVFAHVPSNMEKGVPAIAFFAHLDTAPEVSGTNVNPTYVTCWGGADIVLNQSMGTVLSMTQFAQLEQSIGDDLIVTDGTTLLGGDDKAGIAEIMEAMEYIMTHKEVQHGDIYICFTPDEEIGNSTEHITISNIPAKYGYTMDGGSLGEVNFENFNAATVKVMVHGKAVHTGSAKGVMKNALLLANEYMQQLPLRERPDNTEGREGFYHVSDMSGNVERAEIVIGIRDFSAVDYAYKKRRVKEIADYLNEYYGEDTFVVEVEDYFLNMAEEVDKCPEVREHVMNAMKMAGVTPNVIAVRGGTDGSSISYMGIPCPNIFTGSCNFHSVYEYCNVQSMEKAVQVILNIIHLFATS